MFDLVLIIVTLNINRLTLVNIINSLCNCFTTLVKSKADRNRKSNGRFLMNPAVTRTKDVLI